MRILHLSSLYAPEQVGGAELMVETLARIQAGLGHAVAVACASRRWEAPTLQDGVTVYRTGHGTPFHSLDWPRHGRLDRLRYKLSTQWNRQTLSRMEAAVRDFAPDVVNTHSISEITPAIWPMLRRLGIPVVHTLHDFTSLCTNGAMAKHGRACVGQHLKCRLYAEPHRRCQRAVSAVAAVGTDILDRHLAAGFFTAIPHSLRQVIWNPIAPGGPSARQPRRPGDPVVFGSLGRIEASKGTDVLLAACRHLPPEGWRLVIAGRAADGLERYRALAEGLPVTFAGYADKDAFLDAIDCLVVPPVWPEAFGRTVAEAYGRAVPVIGTAVGGIGEQVGPGPWLVPPGDAAALAAAMARVVAAPECLPDGLSRAEAVRSGTDPDAVAAAYLALYAAVRAGVAASPPSSAAGGLLRASASRRVSPMTASVMTASEMVAAPMTASGLARAPLAPTAAPAHAARGVEGAARIAASGPLRILHLSALYPPYIVGGAERSVEHLAEELVAAGHIVAAACIAREAEPKIVRNGVTVYRMAHNNDFWLEDWPKATRVGRTWAKLKQQWNFAIAAEFGRVLDDFRPDIVNTHSLLDVSTLVWREAAKRGIPIVHTVCEYDLICGNAAMFRHGKPCTHWHLGCKVVNATKQITNRAVGAVVSVGTEILKTHVDHGLFRHLAPERRRVIYYSCTVPDGDPEARRRIDRTGRPLTFGYLGRINVEKGVGTLVDAFRAVGPGDWRCLVAGQAMDDSIDRFRAQAEGLPIEFVGWAKPADFLSEIDVLIVPSFWAEPSPRTIYEAYVMGVPVIGAASGGIPELIGEDNAAWLFTPGNAAELADRVRAVIARGRVDLPDERSFQHVIRESTSERVAEKYLDLYAELVDERRADRA